MKRRIAPLVALALTLATAAGGTEMTVEMLDHLPPAQVVILGEVHDNPTHHANQARALAALAPRAVVFEMLDIEQSLRITEALTRDPDGLARVLEWEKSGWPDFAMYAPLFQTRPMPRFYGGAVREVDLARARKDGPAAAFGRHAARFGLDRPLPPAAQSAREAEMQAAHCNMLPPEALPRFVAAQRLRDAALAFTVLIALEETGGPVAVITGNGHARRDSGIPAVLAVADPSVSVLTIGQIEAPEAAPPFDRWIVTGPHARTGPDPCEAFRQGG